MTSLLLPPLIGHRGAAAQAPENTMASFRQAAKLGLRWIELDVYLTTDGSLAVIHDRDLARTTTSIGDVTTLDSQSLKRLDAGSKFSANFTGEPVPTLVQVLDFCTTGKLGINIELKENEGEEEATVHAIRQATERFPVQILLSSFDQRMIAAAQKILPQAPRGILFEALPPNWQTIAARYACLSIHCNQSALTLEHITAMDAEAYTVTAYTVNDPKRAEILWGWGVQSLFTDLPPAMLPFVNLRVN